MKRLLSSILCVFIFAGCSTEYKKTVIPPLQLCKKRKAFKIRPFRHNGKVCMTEYEYKKLIYRNNWQDKCIDLQNGQAKEFNEKFANLKDSNATNRKN